MPAPFSDKHHKSDEITAMVNEMIAELNRQADEWNGNGLLKMSLDLSVVGHGIRPFGQYEKNDYRDFAIKIGKKEWKGLTRLDIQSIGQSIRKVKGFEIISKDHYIGFGQLAPDFQYPTDFIKYGEPCKEFKELAKLVEKKYGIELKLQDLYLVRMSGTIKDQEVGDRTYIAYAPYRCKQLIEKIKSFGRKHTTCEITTIDDFEWIDNERAVWLDIQPKAKSYRYGKV